MAIGVTFNGQSSVNGMVCLSRLPNILRVSDIPSSGMSKAQVNINITNLSEINPDSDYTLTVLGKQIHSTTTYSKATGNYFWLTDSDTYDNRVKVAHSICGALSNIGILSANYYIFVTDDEEPVVTLVARQYGSKFNMVIALSPSSAGIEIDNFTATDGGRVLTGKTNTCEVKLFSRTDGISRIGSLTPMTDDDFKATLAKEFTGTELTFDLANLFTNLVDFGQMAENSLIVSTYSDGIKMSQNAISGLYSVQGYWVNQGDRYIAPFGSIRLAANYSRGGNSTYLNKTELYTAQMNIPLSVFTTSGYTGSKTVTINYLGGAMNNIATQTQDITFSSNLQDITVIPTNTAAWKQASYVSVSIPQMGALLYRIVKPTGTHNEVNRVYWQNSYGGVSFFDFVGSKTDSRKNKVETYSRNIFDFYESEIVEKEKVYSKENEITVSLKTHIISEDATWLLYDLQDSSDAWTEVNGQKYKIIVTNLEIDEQTVPETYIAEIEYRYSLGEIL